MAGRASAPTTSAPAVLARIRSGVHDRPIHPAQRDDVSSDDVLGSIVEALEWEAMWEADAMRVHPDLPTEVDGDLLPGEVDEMARAIAALASLHVDLTPMTQALARFQGAVAKFVAALPDRSEVTP